MNLLLPAQVKTCLESLQLAGFSCYAVGGCVRDRLLGKEPNDWDITTSATPDEIEKVFHGYRFLEIGKKHGTVTVEIDGAWLEVTTYRIDGEYRDNRHPLSVTFSRTLEDDLARRDFTVNAMAYNEKDGLCDLFGGQKDLKNKTIRAVGDAVKRFREDGLRILRALRFASVLDFSLEKSTHEAVFSEKSLLAGIAKERLREEFCKLLLGDGAVRILRDYRDVIAVFMPVLKEIFDVPQVTKYHCFDVWEHTLQTLTVAPKDLTVRLTLLCHDLGKGKTRTTEEGVDHFFGHGTVSEELTREALKDLRFDGETVKRVSFLVKYHDLALAPTEKAVKRFLAKVGEEDLSRFFTVQECDRHGHAEEYREMGEDFYKVKDLVKKLQEEHACFSLATLAVKGDDLMALHIPEGKEVGVWLSRLLDAVMDGTLPNEKEALLTFVKNQLSL